jgi:hypothetical protein
VTLDETETIAYRHIGSLIAIYGALPPPQGSGDLLAYRLARAVLAMLPVVRAALAWSGAEHTSYPASEDYARTIARTEIGLLAAIDTMRAAIGERE